MTQYLQYIHTKQYSTLTASITYHILLTTHLQAYKKTIFLYAFQFTNQSNHHRSFISLFLIKLLIYKTLPIFYSIYQMIRVKFKANNGILGSESRVYILDNICDLSFGPIETTMKFAVN